MPSPNMPTLDTATVYPGMCLFEGTNLSEGRGTTRPFELFGAPFIDSEKLIGDLAVENLPGVHFRAADFEPTFHKFAGEVCHGAQIHVTDRDGDRVAAHAVVHGLGESPVAVVQEDRDAAALRHGEVEVVIAIEVTDGDETRIELRAVHDVRGEGAIAVIQEDRDVVAV